MVLFSFLLFFFFLWCVTFSISFDYYLDRCGFQFSEALLMLDEVSLICLLMLSFCGVIVLFFCIHYMGVGSVFGRRLSILLFIFLAVMGCLVSSYCVLMTLVMWEYLGIVSFLLILFYGNLDSLRATIVTLFASRFGDVCLFGLVAYFYVLFDGCGLLCIMVLLVVLTKSACFPFISWLLEAMRAPTPVSSLVHSSTLVAAGVWFLFRYGGGYIVFDSFMFYILFVLSVGTILISSFCSVVFLDLKKIVALSTCNNISWCIVFFIFGDIFLGLFQLLSHGVAKCYLFVGLGDLMSGSSSFQDSRGVFCSSYGDGLASVVYYGVLVLSLCGIPFLGIFFSKHELLSSLLWSYNVSCYVILFFSFLMSYIYSFRLLGLLCGFRSLGVYSYGCFFVILSVLSFFCSFVNFFLVGSSEEVFFIDFSGSFFLLLVQVLGALVGVLFYYYSAGGGFSLFGFFVGGCDSLVGIWYEFACLVFYSFLFLMYRWEVFILLYFRSFFLGTWVIGWRSLKFLVLCGVCVIGLCFVFV